MADQLVRKTLSVEEGDKTLIGLLLLLHEQTNKLLEDVIRENRSLKEEINTFKTQFVRYEGLEKDIECCMQERKDCKKEFDVIKSECSKQITAFKEEINNKREAMGDKITDIRLEVTKIATKYGTIVSIVCGLISIGISILLKSK